MRRKKEDTEINIHDDIVHGDTPSAKQDSNNDSGCVELPGCGGWYNTYG